MPFEEAREQAHAVDARGGVECLGVVRNRKMPREPSAKSQYWELFACSAHP
jgi:hypothetical protein